MIKSVARYLDHVGVTANMVTLMGLAMMLVSASFILSGRFVWAAIFMMLSGLMDLLDGRIARAQVIRSSFGALLDSSIDRYADAVLFSAVAVYFLTSGQGLFAVLALSALAGTFQISYVKARAEGLKYECPIGFWQRPERIILIIVAFLVNNLGLAILYLGVFTHVTALHRLLYVRLKMEQSHFPEWFKTSILSTSNRSSKLYISKAVLIVLTLLFVRIA